MARFGDGYSRFIAFAKVALPLAALAILSTVFLVAREPQRGGAPDDSERAAERIARDERIGAPAYSGVTDDGTALSVTAESARPEDAEGRVSATALDARFDLPSGGAARVTADRGVIDTGADRARFTEGVVLTESGGWRLTTERMVAALDHTEVTSDTEVEATGPPGKLTAGAMRLTAGAGGGHVLVFTGGVKLIYHPDS